MSILWVLLIVLLNIALNTASWELLNAAITLIAAGGISFSYVFLFCIVRNLRDIRHLKKTIYLDPMTGLFNRSRMFMDAADKMREKTPFYLIYIDLDDFKKVNDSFGHLAGDEYLCKFATVTKRLIESKGCLYRMSGDEFICLYTEKDPEVCLRQLEKFSWQSALGDIKFQGFSVGISEYPYDGKGLDELISIADNRMYQDKQDSKDFSRSH